MKTASKQLSEQLKEAGFLQDSYFYWFKAHQASDDSSDPYFVGGKKDGNGCTTIAAAPTAEEILERLPKNTTVYIYDDYFTCNFQGETKTQFINQSFNEPNLAEAAGKLYLYLKKQGLLSDSKKKETED